MRSGNFVIASDYITTNRSGGAIQSDVAMQISQDGFVNLPNDMNLWGDIYCKRSVEATNSLSIKATAANSETKIAIFGGSSVNNYWIIGQDSFSVGANNLMFGNSASGVVMRLDQNGDITIPTVLSVGGNAFITTLQVNQTSYLNNVDIQGTLTFNNVDINTLYHTHAWVS